MSRKDELLALAERVEALAAACLRCDALIYIAINPDEQIIIGAEPGRFPQKPIYGPITELRDLAENSADPCDAAHFLTAPAYTASLDAAMSLVPEGFACFHLFCVRGARFLWEADIGADGPDHRGQAATPALALTAAALRALAATEQ